MKLLIISGSPRKKGLISQMLRIFHEQAIATGVEVTEVYANDLQIKPCMGCMACRSKRHCVLLEDDAQRVLTLIQQADALVIGAPCYWGNIPGLLKLLFGRNV